MAISLWKRYKEAAFVCIENLCSFLENQFVKRKEIIDSVSFN
jgi:hypothetical protein